jgi:hypothetical protein
VNTNIKKEWDCSLAESIAVLPLQLRQHLQDGPVQLIQIDVDFIVVPALYGEVAFELAVELLEGEAALQLPQSLMFGEGQVAAAFEMAAVSLRPQPE